MLQQTETCKVKSLSDYQNEIQKDVCRWCNYQGLKTLQIKSYDHDGGWTVDGFDHKQWLYIVCPKCYYEWSLWKLGVSREDS